MPEVLKIKLKRPSFKSSSLNTYRYKLYTSMYDYYDKYSFEILGSSCSTIFPTCIPARDGCWLGFLSLPILYAIFDWCKSKSPEAESTHSFLFYDDSISLNSCTQNNNHFIHRCRKKPLCAMLLVLLIFSKYSFFTEYSESQNVLVLSEGFRKTQFNNGNGYVMVDGKKWRLLCYKICVVKEH